MVKAVTSQADGDGRSPASSMCRPWKQWSFADKRQASPWITMLILRSEDRMRTLENIPARDGEATAGIASGRMVP
jgi:hypothetical protein